MSLHCFHTSKIEGGSELKILERLQPNNATVEIYISKIEIIQFIHSQG